AASTHLEVTNAPARALTGCPPQSLMGQGSRESSHAPAPPRNAAGEHHGGSPMVVESVRYTLPEARRADFESAYADAARSLDASPECLAYELCRCMDEPASYVLRIES